MERASEATLCYAWGEIGDAMSMTLKQFREWFAPFLQWPVTLRRVTWLDKDRVEWSQQYPGVLDAGPRAFERLRSDYPEPC